MDLGALNAWLERYFAAWGSNNPEDVAALFADDAVYSYSPFREPTRGRDAIVREWIEGGFAENLEYRFEPLAVDGRRGIARWAVSFTNEGNAARTDLDGVLVLDFDDADRCREHREWY
jgi:nuclear transport factor 2 (NTF2) superfamily protein